MVSKYRKKSVPHFLLIKVFRRIFNPHRYDHLVTGGLFFFVRCNVKYLRVGTLIRMKRQDVHRYELFRFNRSDNLEFTGFGSADYQEFT